MNAEELSREDSKKVKRHTISSGIWLLIFSALFVALIVVADEYQVFGMTEVYVRGAVILILTFASGIWIGTAIWFVQRVKKNFLRKTPGFLRTVLVFLILSSSVMLAAFLLQLYSVYGGELTGDYEWAIYVVIGIYGLFIFGSTWHLVKVFKPGFAVRKTRPTRHRAGRVVFAILSLSLVAGISYTFIDVGMASSAGKTPYPFTFEPGTENTSVILLIGDGMGMEQIKFGSLIEYGSEDASSLCTWITRRPSKRMP